MLPEHYRAPLILTYMEGLRHDEVARRLGCPVGTVESRLSRARDRLRIRLTRRGLAPTASVLGLVASGADASAAVALPAIVERTVEAAIGLSSQRVGILASLLHRWGRPVLGVRPTLQVGAAVSMLVVCVGLGYSVLGSGNGPPRSAEATLEPSTAIAPRINESRPESNSPEIPPAITSAEPKGESPELQQDQETLPAVQADSDGTQTKDTLKPTRASFAYAPPLTGIVIDGQLDDWPAAIPHFPIDKILDPDPTDALGDGGLRGANLWTSPDLSAAFSVGYDPKEQLIYVAVIVRDDNLIIGHESHLDTDAVEIYVDGLHSDRQIPFPPTADAYYALDPAEVPVQQYVAIPGRGMIYGRRQASNPILIHGTARETKTRMAFTRKGGVTTYEWGIQVFDRYHDKPTVLAPGKRIGFDVAVADKDVPATSPGGFNDPRRDRSAWIYWGPTWRGVKTLDAGALGELILVR